jgi:putative transposase
MIKSFKVKLKINDKQRTHFNKCAGVSRWAYNWALGYEKENYEKNKDNVDKKTHFVNNFDLRKILTQLKQNDESYKWLYDYDVDIVKQAVKDAEKSYLNFFKNKTGFPKFKSKRKTKPSFFIDNMKIKINKQGIKIPKLKSTIKFHEKDYIPIGNIDNKSSKKNDLKVNNENIKINSKNKTDNNIIKYLNPRITSDGIDWFLSVGIETENNNEKIELTDNILGIDLGLKDLAICSNGKVYKNNNKNKKLKLFKKRQRRLQRKISKKYLKNKQGNKFVQTRNIIKDNKKLQKTYIKLNNIQRDYFNKIVLEIARTKPSEIVLENLNIQGMQKNKHLSKSIQESSLFLFKTLLINKCSEFGIKITNADRFYPSSKLCSNCGNKKDDLKLKDRIYKCDNINCNLHYNPIDRDYNASLNLAKYPQIVENLSLWRTKSKESSNRKKTKSGSMNEEKSVNL